MMYFQLQLCSGELHTKIIKLGKWAWPSSRHCPRTSPECWEKLQRTSLRAAGAL